MSCFSLQGLPDNRVILTSTNHPTSLIGKPEIRLVDGPSILEGRLQIYHRGKWRSVCTNSRNWTRADLETTCRHLGFQGGEWWGWMNREPGVNLPRLLLEKPRCSGTEKNLFECQWNSRQLGSGVCDYHPDLGIKCLPAHASNTATVHHWRGIRFENAKFDKKLKESNTLYVPESKSKMQNVDILYAGSGRDYNASSALTVLGVAPLMSSLNVFHSAYNGINITLPEAPVILTNSTIRGNRGYGVVVNGSHGDVLIENTVIADNGGDGIRFARHEPESGDQFDRSSFYDFCMIPTTASQTYPVVVWMQQNEFNPTTKECYQNFRTANGRVLTFEVDYAMVSENDMANILVYDGSYFTDALLVDIPIRNNSRPQSVVTTSNSLFVAFKAKPYTNTLVYIRITAGLTKKYDLNITGSSIVDNNGRGVAVENIKSSVYIHQTSVSNNKHIAGIHVFKGAGDINITESRIAFNQGDGVNISYSGGSRNITRSVLSSNKGYGIAVWLNDTTDPEYVSVNQETSLSYSELFKNEFAGILVGNFCGNSIVNISGNWFNESVDNAIEVQTCWLRNVSRTQLQIGHNVFNKNEKLGIKIVPALNLYGRIEYNYITEHTYGGILVKNPIEYEEQFDFDLMPTDLLIHFNEMQYNKGVYVVNLGLSPYSDVQKIVFTRNFIRYNKINEPFDKGQGYTEEGKVRLNPRSRVAAPVVISSSNVDIFRNIIQNHESKYEIGSHLEDQSKVLNCTFNWLGYSQEEKIYYRLFHRKDRYNLAKIEYLPYLLHSSNPATLTTVVSPTFVPQFMSPGSNVVGGEVDGIESLPAGQYVVERDINIRPGGKLTLHSGVTLRFPPSVGLMVAGRLEARGHGPNNILFTLKQDRIEPVEETTEQIPVEDDMNVRLLGGRSSMEGRLQVKVDGRWGTVCNYGWNVINAALVCHQLGLVLNPNDWYLERSEIPLAGTSEEILLSNVKCTPEDLEITKCKSERSDDFEGSCTHENDVGIRCHEPSWAGVRFGVLAEPTTLQYVTIEKAGLLDHATNLFKPALQIDFSRHSLENVRVVSNAYDGLGVIYSDLYSSGASNTVRNSEFSSNRGNGISFKQLGLTVIGSTLENNKLAGIRHDSSITKKQQRELSGWFIEHSDPYIYNPVYVPHSFNFNLEDTESRYMITQRISRTLDPIVKVFTVKVSPGYVIGIQLLNPIQNRSTEQIQIYDSQNLLGQSEVWDVGRDLTVFPMTSSSFAITVKYSSGSNALGGCVIMVSSVRAPVQNIPHRVVRGAIPSLTIKDTRIKGNERGVWTSHYNRYMDDFGDHFLRQSNESIVIIGCEISHNRQEAIYVHSPYWNVHRSNISEITFVINSTLLIDNGRGIYHFSRDVRQSNNLFHWFLHDNSIERNINGGFEVTLPYVWQYNENFTHSLGFVNNTFRNNNQFSFVIDGHYANLTMTDNIFTENKCRTGLISFRGMEKFMNINGNTIERNSGSYMVEFRIESQSEILGFVPAAFRENVVKGNGRLSFAPTKGVQQYYRSPSFVIGFHGIQDVRINNNLFGGNSLDYELIAGIRTAKLETYVDVSQNWWGSSDINYIKDKIFDFDDWNNHAIANFRPYLIEDRMNGSLSVSWETPSVFDTSNIGGRIKTDMILYPREEPYLIRRDITIMPEATLTIAPGVVMEFEPNVGILVLGTLKAQGRKQDQIIFRPAPLAHSKDRYPRSENLYTPSVRLCARENCTLEMTRPVNHGFLEYYNRTTLQWVPVCDDRFTERNAQVVCKELGFDSLNVRFDLGPRVEFHPNSLTRIWSYPEPLQCTGNEDRLEECEVRLNGQQYNHIHRCEWNSNFVFVHCGERNLPKHMLYWGGIRFANGRFEQNFYEHRIHDIVTHETARKSESVLVHVNITGAGILHNEKSPAVQAIVKSPHLTNLNITLCAHDGINLISPSDHIRLLFSSIQNNLGAGVSVLSITGEGRDSEESSFTPLKEASVPYHIFSLVDMCDTNKEILVEERVILYYKYDNVPVNCVKIFRNIVKPFGFRLLQFNLYNSTTKPGRPDSLSLYDGSIYNVSAPLLTTIEVGSPFQKKMIKSTGPSLSVRLFANGASSVHGFIAEIVTLPISAIGFNRDVQHNISYSVVANNERGAIAYQSAGEVNPTLTVEWNQFSNNCKHLYGNFTTCTAAVQMDVQNPQNFYFRNNLIKGNQGGLHLRTDSRGSATALKGWINNNLWTENQNKPVLHVEGRKNSAYQEVTIFRNYFSKNFAPYENTIIFKQVISNFTYNYLQENWGAYILEVSGFEKVRLPIYQSASHNGFYYNYGMNIENHATILAGTAGQHYVDNVLYNPDNDYEIVTVNRSLAGLDRSLDIWKSSIDAKHNWWGFNETLAVSGRIRDRSDESDLLEVDFQPFLHSNKSILDDKCPPGWKLFTDTCFIYIGAPMTFQEARAFCEANNSTMPYLFGNYLRLYEFLRSQQDSYRFYDRIWVRHLDKINDCTAFAYQTVAVDDCDRLSPFICEIDPEVQINLFFWKDDTTILAVLGAAGGLVILMGIILVFWCTKCRKRREERLERRNSIRQSLRSLKSVGSTNGLSDLGYRQNMSSSQRSSPTLVKDYKKMMNGSLDSMEKCQYNSSIDETQSYDIYEAHNPNMSTRWDHPGATRPSFDLTYQNRGFRDTSTFTSRENNAYSESNQGEDYYEAGTLPLAASVANTDSIVEMKKGITLSPKYDSSRYRPNNYYAHTPTFERSDTARTPDSELTDNSYFYNNPPPMQTYYDYNNSVLDVNKQRPSAESLLETNIDEGKTQSHVLPKAKSEALLETNFDICEVGLPPTSEALSLANRSKSQPLETSM
ncbi:hypothetical protein RUM43_011535 [Polyplax serrata]|uniref:SRCR domain-containing protein n=1 Tax=Polyplax serrata TaxID=468196 RepID=A0AAN8S3Q4_POLSC